jgi:hypothetical protein
MRYFKTIENGYIVALQTVTGQTEITEQEYNEILNAIRNKPIAESGYGYKLKDNLTWELYEITEEEYAEKLKEGERNA